MCLYFEGINVLGADVVFGLLESRLRNQALNEEEFKNVTNDLFEFMTRISIA